MQINGNWRLFADNVLRPCVHLRVRLSENYWQEFPFLLDSGADDTVLSADLLELVSHLENQTATKIPLEGIGGAVDTILIETVLGFIKDDGTTFEYPGRFSVFTEISSSDISMLGRDVTDQFKVIYDRPDSAVLLLSPPHRYEITTA